MRVFPEVIVLATNPRIDTIHSLYINARLVDDDNSLMENHS